MTINEQHPYNEQLSAMIFSQVDQLQPLIEPNDRLRFNASIELEIGVRSVEVSRDEEIGATVVVTNNYPEDGRIHLSKDSYNLWDDGTITHDAMRVRSDGSYERAKGIYSALKNDWKMALIRLNAPGFSMYVAERLTREFLAAQYNGKNRLARLGGAATESVGLPGVTSLASAQQQRVQDGSDEFKEQVYGVIEASGHDEHARTELDELLEQLQQAYDHSETLKAAIDSDVGETERISRESQSTHLSPDADDIALKRLHDVLAAALRQIEHPTDTGVV